MGFKGIFFYVIGILWWWCLLFIALSGRKSHTSSILFSPDDQIPALPLCLLLI